MTEDKTKSGLQHKVTLAIFKETGTEFGQGQYLDSISLFGVKAVIRVKARTKNDLTKCLI